jgi:CO/xanthine dehydrogenase FAD-binding subunit
LNELGYASPATVSDAIALLAAGEARPLAGGTDLIVQLREGRRSAQRVVDLKRIPELVAISAEPDGGFRIGAAASFGRLAAHPELAHAHPAIIASGRLVGSLQIQNRASLGGNICNAAPSADAIPALICLGARAEIAGPSGHRVELVESLFVGPGRTTLRPDEILVSVMVPPPPPLSAACYLRFTPRREMDIAVAGAGVWIRLDAGKSIADACIALASVAPVPLRAPAAETALKGQRPSDALFREAGRIAAQEARPISDTRGSAEYRRELVATLTRRALAACTQDLKLGIDAP